MWKQWRWALWVDAEMANLHSVNSAVGRQMALHTSAAEPHSKAIGCRCFFPGKRSGPRTLFWTDKFKSQMLAWPDAQSLESATRDFLWSPIRRLRVCTILGRAMITNGGSWGNQHCIIRKNSRRTARTPSVDAGFAYSVPKLTRLSSQTRIRIPNFPSISSNAKKQTGQGPLCRRKRGGFFSASMRIKRTPPFSDIADLPQRTKPDILEDVRPLKPGSVSAGRIPKQELRFPPEQTPAI